MSSLTPRIDRIDKNYLINGAFDHFQRSTGSITIGGGYSYQTADRWAIGYNAPLTSQTSGMSTIVPDNNVKRSIRLSGNASSSSGNLLIRQRIEAANAVELAGKTISISCWVRSESASQIGLNLATPTVEDNFTSVNAVISTDYKTLTVGTSWQLVTWENISIPAAANLGLQVGLELKNFTVTGLIKDHYITKVMLNIGDTAAEFARTGRNISEELQLCQRYFQVINNFHSIGWARNTDNFYTCSGFSFPVQMRTTPTPTAAGAGNYVLHIPNQISVNPASVTLVPLNAETWYAVGSYGAIPAGVWVMEFSGGPNKFDAEL